MALSERLVPDDPLLLEQTYDSRYGIVGGLGLDHPVEYIADECLLQFPQDLHYLQLGFRQFFFRLGLQSFHRLIGWFDTNIKLYF